MDQYKAGSILLTHHNAPSHLQQTMGHLYSCRNIPCSFPSQLRSLFWLTCNMIVFRTAVPEHTHYNCI
jgi:hypothetical protein